MTQRTQAAGGFLSPVVLTHINREYHNRYDIQNKYHYDIDLHVNSSKTQILSMTGSNNKGLLLNDARFNVTNIFNRPIFLNLNPYSIFIYIIVVILLFAISVMILIFMYYRRRRQQSKREQHLSLKDVHARFKNPAQLLIHQPDLKNKAALFSATKTLKNNHIHHRTPQLQQHRKWNINKVLEQGSNLSVENLSGKDDSIKMNPVQQSDLVSVKQNNFMVIADGNLDNSHVDIQTFHHSNEKSYQTEAYDPKITNYERNDFTKQDDDFVDYLIDDPVVGDF
ncbi:unnamed protein product [Rotaria sp. Silwood1]|nr:unnamed protein product [Rotaria sp. Silwood1]